MRNNKDSWDYLSEWKQYSDIDRQEITVGEGIRLLLMHWPESPRNDQKDILNQLREKVKTAVKQGNLSISGKGEKAKIPTKEFFEWAVCWRDVRHKKTYSYPLICQAARAFGVLIPPTLRSAIITLPRLQAICYPHNLPVSLLMEIEDADLRNRVISQYQVDMWSRDEEIRALKKEIEDLRPDAEKWREQKFKRQQQGREAHSKNKK